MGLACFRKKLFGLLVTTWNSTRSHTLPLFYYTGACSAWNPTENTPVKLADRLTMNVHLRQICQDMRIIDYERFGCTSFQVDKHPNPA